jgi:hypothetical protein
MLKLIDIQDDPSFTLLKNSKIEIPQFVLNSVVSQEKYAGYETNQFAVLLQDGPVTQEKYPIASDADVWLSTYYFEKCASELPTNVYTKIGAKLGSEYVRRHLDKITPLENFFLTKAAMMVENEIPEGTIVVTSEDAKKAPILSKFVAEQAIKEAAELSTEERNRLPDSDFAVVATIKGKKVRKYPVHDKSHVLAALKYAKNLTKLPPNLRATAARKIKSAAKRFGINVSDDNYVNKYASEYATDLEEQIVARTYFADKRYKKEYTELLSKQASMDPDEFATELAKVDIKTGIAGIWDKLVPDPYLTTFGARKKTASSQLEQEFEEYKYRLKEKQADLEKYLDTALTDKLIKNPNVFSSLPASMQEMIVTLLQS